MLSNVTELTGWQQMGSKGGNVEGNDAAQISAQIAGDIADDCAGITYTRGEDLRVKNSRRTSRRRRHFLCRRNCLLVTLCLLTTGFLVSLLALFLGVSEPENDVCLNEHCVKTAAVLLNSIDTNVDPCDDFFTYACGSWNKRHVIPEDKSSFNTFEKLHDELQVKLKYLLENKISNKDTNGTRKAKILYASCIDEESLERIGDEPLRRLIGSVNLGDGRVAELPLRTMDHDGNSSTDKEQPVGKGGSYVWRLLGEARRMWNDDSLMNVWVSIDDKNSSLHVLQLDQPSLGMPSREYYLKQEEFAYREAYLRFMTNVAILLGAPKAYAKIEMTRVLLFEIQLAKIMIPQSERHDTGKMYKKLTVEQLVKQIPEVDWMLYFNSFMNGTISKSEEIVTFATEYMSKMGKLVQNTDDKVVANYILWRLVLGLVPEMTEKYQNERSEYRRVLQGVSRKKVRWQKCVEYVNGRLGMAIGRLFIEQYFDVESKHTAVEMIKNIRKAFIEILEESDWMDSETKKVAIEKANSINERIGYPELILNSKSLDKMYTNLEFKKDTYFENILRVEAHDSEYNLAKLRKPVIKEKWEQDPAIVNAFYNPNMNDIVFPAGILQPLFYSQHFPKSLNYGGIGVVIGHEITHGFDDKGRQYDKDGNLRQWWNNKTIKAFRERTKCIVEQYDKYKLQPFGLKIDGKNTQGENIADNGGLKESFRAYRKWVAKNGEEKKLPGISLSHNQLFFLNYAQIWCGVMRDEEALHKVRTSVHSPGPIRVLGPLSNSHEFSTAFNCKSGSPMNPVHKCNVW